MTDRVPLISKVPGGPLRVLMIGRISQEDQDPESIDADPRDALDSPARIDNGPIDINSPVNYGEIQEDQP